VGRPVTPARWPRADAGAERLLVIDPRAGRHESARVRDLAAALVPGDVLVLNDAATLPASLHGTTARGDAVEVRLVTRRGDGAWTALLFGRGDWRTRTEDRPPPPPIAPGDELRFHGLACRVASVSGPSGRIAVVRFEPRAPGDDAAFWSALYRAGRPVQYAYVERDLALWHVQTAYAGRPWAAEMPSAGRPLGWSLLLGLARRGVRLAHVTHAAGLSSSGDPAIDALLPMAERYDVPPATASAIREARAGGGRIVAVGTTVVRALEGAAANGGGTLAAGEGETTLLIGPGFRPRVVDALFTGIHDATASHFALLQAFAPRPILEAAYATAERDGFLGHEFGDSTLILPGALGDPL